MNVDKRKATLDDKNFIYMTKKEALYKYVDSIWGWDEVVQVKLFEENLNLNNIQILTSVAIKVGILEVDYEHDYIQLTNIEIIPEYRNLGIGSQLLKDIIKKAKADEKDVKLRVFKQNFQAIKLYKKIGFTEYSHSEHHINLELKL